MKLCQFSGLPVNCICCFSSSFSRSCCTFTSLIKHFTSILSVLRIGSTMAFLWCLCAFREGTDDYFLYNLIKLAKLTIFLMERSLPARQF